MINRLRFATVFAALVTTTACGTDRSGSLTPTGPPPIAPTPPVTGTITLSSIVPANGTTLTIFDCDPTLPAGAIGPLHEIGLCTDQLRMTFDLEVDRDITDAYLKVQLLDGSKLCAITSGGRAPLSAGTRTQRTTSPVVLSDHPELQSPCALPVTTTRIRVELQDGIVNRQLLAQEFDYTYRFQMQ